MFNQQETSSIKSNNPQIRNYAPDMIQTIISRISLMRKPDRCKGVRWSMQRDSVKMAPRYIKNVKTSVRNNG